MNFLFALFAAIVVNGDFESGKGTDVPGWPLSKEGKKHGAYGPALDSTATAASCGKMPIPGCTRSRSRR
jgi:hypothetical protein